MTRMPRPSPLRTRSLLAAAAVLAALPLSDQVGGGVAHAAPDSRCFASGDLAQRAGEKAPVKGIRTFDRAEPERPLAAFAPVPAHLRGAIRRVDVPPGRKLIALTLDLCEQNGEIAGYDGAIVDYLRQSGIKATLFAGGKWMRSHGTRAEQLLADPLFEIANHSWSHKNLRQLQDGECQREIVWPQRAYEATRERLAARQCLPDAALARVPARMGLFRFPFGACNAAALAAVNDAGLLAIQWDLSTGDPSPSQSAKEIAETMVRNARPGSIIIAHANGRGYNTAAALPMAIPRLLAAGFEFVTVGELIAAGRPVVVDRCYDSRPGDTDRYDHPLGLTNSAVPRPWSTATSPIKPAAKP